MLAPGRQYFSLEDLLKIRHRLVGSGFIGGKAVGYAAGSEILARYQQVPWIRYLEPHDSFYIGRCFTTLIGGE
jgi:hypothetical protein